MASRPVVRRLRVATPAPEHAAAKDRSDTANRSTTSPGSLAPLAPLLSQSGLIGEEFAVTLAGGDLLAYLRTCGMDGEPRPAGGGAIDGIPVENWVVTLRAPGGGQVGAPTAPKAAPQPGRPGTPAGAASTTAAGTGETVRTITLSYGREDRLLRRVVSETRFPDGRVFRRTETHHDIKVGGTLPDSLFAFTPPPGAIIIPDPPRPATASPVPSVASRAPALPARGKDADAVNAAREAWRLGRPDAAFGGLSTFAPAGQPPVLTRGGAGGSAAALGGGSPSRYGIAYGGPNGGPTASAGASGATGAAAAAPGAGTSGASSTAATPQLPPSPQHFNVTFAAAGVPRTPGIASVSGSAGKPAAVARVSLAPSAPGATSGATPSGAATAAGGPSTPGAANSPAQLGQPVRAEPVLIGAPAATAATTPTSATAASVPTPAPGTLAALPEGHAEVGTVSLLEQATAEVVFPVRNAGTAPLTLARLQASCGCLSAVIQPAQTAQPVPPAAAGGGGGTAGTPAAANAGAPASPNGGNGPNTQSGQNAAGLATLAPGQEALVRVLVNLAGVRPGPFTKTVLVYANDATGTNGRPAAQLTLTGTLRPVAAFDPPALALGRVEAVAAGESAGKGAEGVVVTVTPDPRLVAATRAATRAAGDTTGRGGTATATAAVPPLAALVPGVTVTPLTEALPASPYAPVTLRYRVRVAPGAPLGPLASVLAFAPAGTPKTADEARVAAAWRSATLVVTAEVAGDAAPEPPYLAFGMVGMVGAGGARATADGASARTVTLRAAPGREASLAGATAATDSPYLTATMEPALDKADKTGAGIVVVRVTLSPAAPAGPIQARLAVTLKNGQRIEVPVSAYVRPAPAGALKPQAPATAPKTGATANNGNASNRGTEGVIP